MIKRNEVPREIVYDRTDLIDKILNIGSTPDWITPLSGLIRDSINGSRYDLQIDGYIGLSVKDVERELRNAGIENWGGMFLEGMIIVSVKGEDAKKAESLFR